MGWGGVWASVGCGTTTGAGIACAVSTSTRVNGYCPGRATAARLISTPVGPLEGRLAQPAKDNSVINTAMTLRNRPLRCGTRIVVID